VDPKNPPFLGREGEGRGGGRGGGMASLK